jgi:hypothetical protein
LNVFATLDSASGGNKVCKRHDRTRLLARALSFLSTASPFSSRADNFPVAFENGLSDTPPRRSDAAHGSA